MTTDSRQLVLIVDDEPRMRDMLTRATTELGFAAVAVRSAEAASTSIAGRCPDVVLLDLNLPGIGGMEFAEQIRRNHPNLPIIILTGFGNLDAAQSAIRLDVTDFLTKPCSLADLEHALSRATRRSRTPPQNVTVMIEETSPTYDTATTLEEVERLHILRVLERHDNNRAAAAAELGISERTLYYRIATYQGGSKSPGNKPH